MYAAGRRSTPFWFWTVTYAREYAALIPLGAGLARARPDRRRDIARTAPALWLLVGVGLTAPWWDAPARRAAAFLGLFALCSVGGRRPGCASREHYFVLAAAGGEPARGRRR